jgi:hypothetical protein
MAHAAFAYTRSYRGCFLYTYVVLMNSVVCSFTAKELFWVEKKEGSAGCVYKLGSMWFFDRLDFWCILMARDTNFYGEYKSELFLREANHRGWKFNYFYKTNILRALLSPC